jgi:hypothetical protein
MNAMNWVFASRLAEFPMVCSTVSARKAVNWDIVGHIDERHVRSGPTQNASNKIEIKRVAAAHPVPTATPDIASATDRELRHFWNCIPIFNNVTTMVDFDDVVDLDRIESGEIEVDLRFGKGRKDCPKLFAFPSGILGDAVQSKAQCESFGRRQSVDLHYGNLVEAERFQNFKAGVAVDKHPAFIHDERIHRAKPPN